MVDLKSEFLELPEEVLITSMKEHQRYFPVKSKDGKLTSLFCYGSKWWIMTI